MANQNFVNYTNATAIVTAIGQKLSMLNGAYVVRGNSTFADLPATLTEAMNGYAYNVTDAFTTDARFVEGAGKDYAANTNVVIVDLSSYAAATPAGTENPSTEGWYELVDGKYVLSTDTTVDSGKTYYAKTVDVKFDVMGAYVNIDGIYTMIAPEFNPASAYVIGDVVIHDGVLYEFSSDHTAADPWDISEVTITDVATLISNAEPNSLTTAQVNALLALLD